ncbi:MAG: hypothetical protein A3I77_02080 [Gammaproteobacteria bacterium RIFCSPLOWO2_02_FULL_42_14]|nr:MAG: hypothetical protein A2624_03195 [Gammaproteobacteria bacterium RIFCSPHIGHO2_01_FULL_42_8]OGT52145.1 MAG: hypothetical protein A3E54_06915 [Gammaproteobacteria bacterium RIFCSPHIGHO2_12_FULL_41_25]OGT62582.1 MAG: hypothetical protein A3I77_02080 [Gammaproteobacteria bacterium RIFCSPLOWO2_02_FULL_42_14]OGT86565.1 MAG: hypothetical protein A3G86_08600 [Gammaproteobacteria bacterium RIFCSPLOWO2_12_FULL_42_18]
MPARPNAIVAMIFAAPAPNKNPRTLQTSDTTDDGGGVSGVVIVMAAPLKSNTVKKIIDNPLFNQTGQSIPEIIYNC